MTRNRLSHQIQEARSQVERLCAFSGEARSVGRAVLEELKNTIEELRACEQELRREQAPRPGSEADNRGRDIFLAAMSHELRTPLNAVIGWIHILRQYGMDSEVGAQALNVIERNALAQAQIINDVLDFSRIMTGDVPLDLGPVDLASIIDASIEPALSLAGEKSITIRKSLDPGAGPVTGDPSRLRQVVGNLLSNAVKFTPEGGEVWITLDNEGGCARITVSDTGGGIDPDFLPNVFDSFRQADSSTTRKFGGLGLGLAIVRQLVEMHGGSVRAESEGPGRGASFQVKLPISSGDGRLEGAAVNTSPRREAGAARKRLEGLSIVVVDDEPDAQELLALVLEQEGARVATAGSASDALSLLLDESASGQGGSRPDLLIADIAMPGEDGVDLIRKLREVESVRGFNIPAIALTAYASNEDRVRILREGYDLHVPKPVKLQDLIESAAELVRNHRSWD